MRKFAVAPIGRRIAGKRVERGWTQQQLAEKANLTQRVVAMIETGKRSGLSLGSIMAIAAELGVSIDYLVYGEKKL